MGTVDVEPSEPPVDGRRRRGLRTREAILDCAVTVASVEGLDGLTLGRLAAELGVSKSGLFAHFESKQELQVATVTHARELFVRHVVGPANVAEDGLPRLRALLDGWLDHLGGCHGIAGCFFGTVETEYDSKQAGPVRDAIVAAFDAWHDRLRGLIATAQQLGQVDRDVDPDQLAFELDALGKRANVAHQLHPQDTTPFTHGRRAIASRLESLARPGAAAGAA